MEYNKDNNKVMPQQPRPNYYQTQQQAQQQNPYRPQQFGQPIAADNKAKNKKVKEPLSNQSKGILFGLLAGFFLFGAIILLVLTFII